MLSQQAKEPANLAEFQRFVDAATEETIRSINDAFAEAFRDKHTTKTGNHPSQLVFRALAPELQKLCSRISSRHPDQYKDVSEINQAFDALNKNIVSHVNNYFTDHQGEMIKLIGEKGLGISDGKFNAALFFEKKIKDRKKKLFSLYIDALRNLAVQRYLLYSIQPENLIICDMQAQVCALSGNFRENADRIGRELNERFSTGNIAEKTEYGEMLSAITEQQLMLDGNLQRLIAQRKLAVSDAVKQNVPRITGAVQEVLSAVSNIQRDIDQYNRAYDNAMAIINDRVVPCDRTTAQRLRAQLEGVRSRIQQDIDDFNRSFAQAKSACVQSIEAELRELPGRRYEPPLIDAVDLRHEGVALYLGIERFLARLEVLSSGYAPGVPENAQVVSIMKLSSIRAQMLERLHNLEGQTEKIVESLIRKAAAGYNSHLRQTAHKVTELAGACDEQHKNNPLWDAAKNAVRGMLGPMREQLLTDEKLQRFLASDMEKATEVVNRTRAEYQKAGTIEIDALERQAREIRRELSAARDRYLSLVNEMMRTQWRQEVTSCTAATVTLLSGMKDTVAALPVDQWRRGVNLRDPRHLDVNYRRQPERPGFFRRHLGKIIGSGTGAVLGAGLGALAGFFLAPVTFGLSIPLLAAIGAVVGGAVVGGGIGAAVGAGIDSCLSRKSPRQEAPVRPVPHEQEPGRRTSTASNLLRLSGEQPGMVRVRAGSPTVEVSASPVQRPGHPDRDGLQAAAPPVQVVGDPPNASVPVTPRW